MCRSVIKHSKCDIFSVISEPVCRTRATKIRISVSQLYPKLPIMDRKGRFHDTPCAPTRLVRYRPRHVKLLGPCSKKAKNMVRSTVLVLFASLCMCVSQLYQKLRIMDKKGRFHDKPAQLVQNVHRFALSAISPVMLHSSAWCPYSTKAKNMVKSTVSVLLAGLEKKTSKLDGLLRDPTVSKVTHYPQKTKFRWLMSNVQSVHYCASKTVMMPLV